MLQGFWNFGFSWPAVNSGVLILLQHMLTRPPIWAPILVVDYLLLDVYDVRGSNFCTVSAPFRRRTMFASRLDTAWGICCERRLKWVVQFAVVQADRGLRVILIPFWLHTAVHSIMALVFTSSRPQVWLFSLHFQVLLQVTTMPFFPSSSGIVINGANFVSFNETAVAGWFFFPSLAIDDTEYSHVHNRWAYGSVSVGDRCQASILFVLLS